LVDGGLYQVGDQWTCAGPAIIALAAKKESKSSPIPKPKAAVGKFVFVALRGGATIGNVESVDEGIASTRLYYHSYNFDTFGRPLFDAEHETSAIPVADLQEFADVHSHAGDTIVALNSFNIHDGHGTDERAIFTAMNTHFPLNASSPMTLKPAGTKKKPQPKKKQKKKK
jgi:hypothetical protein